MSRAHDARQKAKRQQIRAEGRAEPSSDDLGTGRLRLLVPVIAVAAILVAVAASGFKRSNTSTRGQIQSEVTSLLSGIPQHGLTLGSKDASATLVVFADLECPTVKQFVAGYLPAIIHTWVRTGALRLEYRSLKTDTRDEHTFFDQEAAALAAGEQNKMWNYALTFVNEQGQRGTNYATDGYLREIASQVRGLDLDRWQFQRKNSRYMRRIAAEVHAARGTDLYSTPSFLLKFSQGNGRRIFGGGANSPTARLEASIRGSIVGLDREASFDVPAFVVDEGSRTSL